MSAVGSALTASALSAAISSALPARPRDNGMPMTALWSQGEQGAWYDPSDFSSLFQDAAGTTPVTAMEQPVGLMLDKRLGLVRGPELVTNGTFDTDTAGWTVSGSGSIAAVGGWARVTAVSAANVQLSQNLNAGGKWVEVTGQYRNLPAGRIAKLVVYNGTSGTDIAPHISTASSGTLRAVGYCPTGVIVQVIGLMTGGVTVGESMEWDNISVRELPGNHASQATTTARPLLSARKNLLTYTATGLSAGSTNWGGSNNTGTLQADGSSLITRTSTTAGCFSQYLGGGISIPVGAQATGRIKVKKGSVGNLYGLRLQGTYPDRADCVINLDTGAITALAGNAFTGVSGAVSGPDVEGFYTITVTTTVAGSALTGFIHGPAAFFTGGWEAASTQLSNAYAKEPQLEYGPSATRYQRVNTPTDYDWVGFPMYLKYDGVDDHFNIPHIDVPAAYSALFAVAVDGGVGAYRALWSQRTSTPSSGDIVYAAIENVWQTWVGNGTNFSMGIGSPVVIGELCVVEARRVGTTGYSRKNLLAEASIFAGAYTPSAKAGRLMAGGDADAAMNFQFNGRMYAAMIVASNASAVSRDSVRRAFANKAGVTL